MDHRSVFVSSGRVFKCNCGITPPEVAGSERLVDTRQPTPTSSRPSDFLLFLSFSSSLLLLLSFFFVCCEILAVLQLFQMSNKKGTRWKGSGQSAFTNRRCGQWGSKFRAFDDVSFTPKKGTQSLFIDRFILSQHTLESREQGKYFDGAQCLETTTRKNYTGLNNDWNLSSVERSGNSEAINQTAFSDGNFYGNKHRLPRI